MNFEELSEGIQALQDQLHSSARLVSARDLGLDLRCGNCLAGEDFIASPTPKNLDYYGGFEYIPAENILRLNDWKVYSGHPRVMRCLTNLAGGEG